MRGIRDFSYGDYLSRAGLPSGICAPGEVQSGLQHSRRLAGHGRSSGNWRIRIPQHHAIVVDHTGLPAERTDEYFERWKGGMAVAATCDNIRWKISGLGMSDNNWTVDSIRRWVLTSIETFGVDRCIFATNWPVDWLWSTYDRAVKTPTRKSSPASAGTSR